MADLSVGCVMVVANGERYLREQLDSMLQQTRAIEQIVVVDDCSTDASVRLVRDILSASIDLRVVDSPAHPRAVSLYSRIAQNFAFGVDLIGTDVVVLADQDDVWLPHRVASHHRWLSANPACAMVAANANLIDAHSRPTGLTLRDRYPVPEAWSSWGQTERMRYVLAHPIATGAVSAVMPNRLIGGGTVPSGWLHDRWYSLSAVANDQLGVDLAPLVNYRTHGQQVVGMSGAGASAAPLHRLRRRLAQPLLGAKKFFDLSSLALHSDLGYRSAYMFPRSVGSVFISGESAES